MFYVADETALYHLKFSSINQSYSNILLTSFFVQNPIKDTGVFFSISSFDSMPLFSKHFVWFDQASSSFSIHNILVSISVGVGVIAGVEVVRTLFYDLGTWTGRSSKIAVWRGVERRSSPFSANPVWIQKPVIHCDPAKTWKPKSQVEVEEQTNHRARNHHCYWGILPLLFRDSDNLYFFWS